MGALEQDVVLHGVLTRMIASADLLDVVPIPTSLYAHLTADAEGDTLGVTVPVMLVGLAETAALLSFVRGV